MMVQIELFHFSCFYSHLLFTVRSILFQDIFQKNIRNNNEFDKSIFTYHFFLFLFLSDTCFRMKAYFNSSGNHSSTCGDWWGKKTLISNCRPLTHTSHMFMRLTFYNLWAAYSLVRNKAQKAKKMLKWIVGKWKTFYKIIN